jgi:hypothetical protein
LGCADLVFEHSFQGSTPPVPRSFLFGGSGRNGYGFGGCV